MSLPIMPTDDTLRRLLLAKALYQAALSSSAAPLRSHRRIIAVVNLDLANETLLKAVVWDLGGGAQPKREYAPLLAQARALVAQATGASGGNPPPLPGEAGATDLHDARNGAQHRGRAPSDEDLAAGRTHTRDFQAGVVNRVWGLDFESLAHSGVIDEPTCRARMEEAEAALLARDHLGAARAARTALSRASALAMQDHRAPFALRMLRTAAFGTEDREMASLRAAVRELTLGLDRAMQVRLVRLTGDHWVTQAGDQWRPPAKAIDQEGAEWAVAYCTEAIIRIEERFGTLTAQ